MLMRSGVHDAGPEVLRLYSPQRQSNIPMATPDINCKNGVVHALNGNYVVEFMY